MTIAPQPHSRLVIGTRSNGLRGRPSIASSNSRSTQGVTAPIRRGAREAAIALFSAGDADRYWDDLYIRAVDNGVVARDRQLG